MYNVEFNANPAPNGYTGKNAITNRNSRLFKLLLYLMGGKATKRDIMANVFHKILRDDLRHNMVTQEMALNNVVSNRGNNYYLYGQALKEGFISKQRVGNSVFYSLTVKGAMVIANNLEKNGL